MNRSLPTRPDPAPRGALLRGLLALALAATGCAPSDGPTDDLPDSPDAMASDGRVADDMASDAAPDAAPDMAPDAMPDPMWLDWQPCDGLQGVPDDRVTCAHPRMPLRRDRPAVGDIDFFVKRVASPTPDGRGLWLLAGGPGQAGDALEPLAAQITALEPGLTVYLPDHRGTGRSSRLTCPEQELPDSVGGAFITGDDEWAACFATLQARYGLDGLAGFSSLEAAADLVDLVDRVGDPRPFVMGISYGTFLAHQYLLLAPDQAEGVVFDSSCDPIDCHLSSQDLWEDRVGRLWLDEVCAGDALCAEKLGPTPTVAVEQLMADLADGHCPDLAGGDPTVAVDATRGLLAQMLLYASLRPALPAFVYRVMRCTPEDLAAITHMYQNVFGGGGGGAAGPGSYSFPLAINIAGSEMWESPPPTSAEAEARYAETLMCRGVSRQIIPQVAQWTPYAPARAGQRAVSERPTLVLQAEYDPATPLDLLGPFLDDFTGPRGYVVLMPHASHSVVAQSPQAANPQGPTCGMQILRAFLDDPEVAPPTDCTAGTLPPQFAGSPGYNQAVFGTADLWEN